MYRVACVLLLCVSAIQAATYTDCGSKVGHYTSVTVSDCGPAQAKCILRRNTNTTMVINFNVDKDIAAVTAKVHGLVSGVPIPFPLAHPDACTDPNAGLTCPVSTTGGPYHYQATFFIEKMYPKLSVDVKFELQDPNSEDIVCVLIPSKIQ